MVTAIRQGGQHDIKFLVNAIIEAEKSGTEVLSYSGIFAIPQKDFESILSQILMEDIQGSELCPSNFLIATHSDRPIGCVSAWIEGQEGLSSNIIKTNSIFYFLDKDRLASIRDHIRIVETLDIPRTPGTLQLESIYVDPDWRGKGVSNQLIVQQIENHKKKSPAVTKAQIQLMTKNKAAVTAYLKAGFTVSLEKTSTEKAITDFLPWRSRMLMEKSI